jgi:hypothetical protein
MHMLEEMSSVTLLISPLCPHPSLMPRARHFAAGWLTRIG